MLLLASSFWPFKCKFKQQLRQNLWKSGLAKIIPPEQKNEITQQKQKWNHVISYEIEACNDVAIGYMKDQGWGYLDIGVFDITWWNLQLTTVQEHFCTFEKLPFLQYTSWRVETLTYLSADITETYLTPKRRSQMKKCPRLAAQNIKKQQQTSPFVPKKSQKF